MAGGETHVILGPTIATKTISWLAESATERDGWECVDDGIDQYFDNDDDGDIDVDDGDDNDGEFDYDDDDDVDDEHYYNSDDDDVCWN